MTKRIGCSLKDFTRRDVLASSILTAALFTAALLLFPPNHETEDKDRQVTARPGLAALTDAAPLINTTRGASNAANRSRP
ncbi:hypothetical protein FJW06_01630 [Mesorhizobium sp. B4-1-3]|nr:hypothetical protein FJW06_01630 [Mesorhizobium sp. B4-1-3]